MVRAPTPGRVPFVNSSRYVVVVLSTYFDVTSMAVPLNDSCESFAQVEPWSV